MSKRAYRLPGDPAVVGVSRTKFLVGAGVGFFILRLVASGWMVIDPGDVWARRENIGGALASVWWIFAWGFGVTFLYGLYAIVVRAPREKSPIRQFCGGLLVSAVAGTTEEAGFRFFMFFNTMVGLRALNFVTFGIVGWVYRAIFIPIGNFLTLGMMSEWLLGGEWILGAAIVSVNAKFRSKHKYLGLLGYVNSWFLGMVMFRMMFDYGLIAAMAAHIAYDAVVFTTAAVMSIFQPSLASWSVDWTIR